jgi:ABC-type branched-subunit amino acid transport system ATPase component
MSESTTTTTTTTTTTEWPGSWRFVALGLSVWMTTSMVTLLSRPIGITLGAGEAGAVNAIVLRLLVAAAVAIPLGGVLSVRTRWTAAAITAAAWSITSVGSAAIVPESGGFTMAWALAGVSDALGFLSLAVLVSVARESRPHRRTGVESVVAVLFGSVALGALAVALAPKAGLSWRGALVALVGVVFPSVFAAATLRLDVDPDFERRGGAKPALSTGEVLSIALADRRRRRGVTAAALTGALVFSLVAFLPALLRDRWTLSVTSSGFVIGAAAFAAALGAMASRVIDGPERRGAFVSLGGVGLFAAALGIGTSRPTFVAALVCAVGVLGAVLASAFSAAASTADDTVRSMAIAVAFAAMSAGGAVGVLGASTVDRRFGTAVALAVVTVPLALFALAGAMSPLPAKDVRDVVTPSPAPAVPATTTAGIAPLLELRNIDVYYGAIQVLFGVNLRIDHDEIVALLGTNGAGKSTALKVIAGQILPRSGAVILDGTDITGLSAERRVPLGLTQIPGGRAVFGSLSVLENLELFGSSLGQDRAALKHGIEQTFRVFPRLEEHRHRDAQTLSGGEQQMLALGKALLLSPRLLCIDELSLGLAPAVVADLLDLVRTIHANGTTVVLVEQSVNVALSIAHRAIFMEKGEIRFDGAAEELRDRSDLLRSVFLQGAAAP